MLAEILTNNNIAKEILGLNRRNQVYVRPLNPVSAKKIADNKILTKRLLKGINIKSPELYKVIRTKRQLQLIDWSSLPKSFVLKPNRGTGGNGIIIFYGKKRNKLEWIRPNGQTMTSQEIALHIENILDGRFSMGNVPDVAIIEERVKNDNVLKQYSFKGVPDIRVIVFNSVPIMAELRLPTKESDGAANLHAGGIGVGIDIASGITTTAIHRNKASFIEDSYDIIETTLDLVNNLPLQGIRIPYWDEILKISVKCQELSGLGLAGVDVALDRDNGPVVFELNARPGIAIQIANMAGLRSRIERVQGLKIKNLEHGIRVAKNLFGGEVEEEIENISGKKVVSLVEKVIVSYLSREQNNNVKPINIGSEKQNIKKKLKKEEKKKETVKAMLDTGVLTSRIDQGLAARIGYLDAVKSFQNAKIPATFETFIDAQNFIDQKEKELELHKDIIRLAKLTEDGKIKVKPVICVHIKISGEEKNIEAIVSSQTDMLYPLLLGRKELKNYLIDTSKTFIK